MATQYRRPNLLGDEGVDFVALTCSRVGALFLARPRQDVGVDGHIELLNGASEPTGQVALVQCKAGLSYVSVTGAYVLRADKAHFETWARYSLPVIGIVYNPAARDARWVDLKAHIRDHPTCLASGPFAVEAPPQQLFSEAQFGVLREHLECYDEPASAEDLVDRYLTGADDEVREEALTKWVSRDRWKPHCCFFLHAALTTETSRRLVRLLVYLQSFYRPHPDRFYSCENDMPEAVRDELQLIARAWTGSLGEAQIVRMLDAIDPDGNLERGSFGQVVMLLLSEVDDVQRKLERIVRSRIVSRDARGYGLGVLVELGLARRQLLASLYRRESDAGLLEIVRWGLDRLRGA